MSKKDLENGLYVVCAGFYYGKVGNATISKPYEVTVQVNSDPNFQVPGRDDKLLHYAQAKLIPAYFESHYEEFPDYRGWRTCSIVDIKREGSTIKEEVVEEGEINFAKMRKKTLIQFCVQHGLITNPSDYGTIQKARQEVADEWENMQIAKEAVIEKEEEEIQEEVDKFAKF